MTELSEMTRGHRTWIFIAYYRISAADHAIGKCTNFLLKDYPLTLNDSSIMQVAVALEGMFEENVAEVLFRMSELHLIEPRSLPVAMQFLARCRPAT